MYALLGFGIGAVWRTKKRQASTYTDILLCSDNEDLTMMISNAIIKLIVGQQVSQVAGSEGQLSIKVDVQSDAINE